MSLGDELSLPSYPAAVERKDPAAVRLFHRHFRDRGGRLEGDGSWDPVMLRWYRLRFWDYLRKFARLPSCDLLDRTHLDFVATAQLNACASRHRDLYLIAIFEGTVVNLHLLFSILLSHPEILVNYGNPRRERCWFRSLAACEWTRPAAEVLGAIDVTGEPPPDFPRDPERRRLAVALTTFALDFLFFHEMAHLFCRHVELFAQNVVDLTEVNEALPSRPASELLDRRALELNADAQAAAVTIQPWLGERLAGPGFFRNPAEALGAWTLAAGFLFLVFDPWRRSVQEYRGTHPHPAVRLLNVGLCGMHAAEAAGGRVQHRFDRILQSSLSELARTCATAELPSAIWQGIREDRATGDELATLSSHLPSVYARLERFGPFYYMPVLLKQLGSGRG